MRTSAAVALLVSITIIVWTYWTSITKLLFSYPIQIRTQSQACNLAQILDILHSQIELSDGKCPMSLIIPNPSYNPYINCNCCSPAVRAGSDIKTNVTSVCFIFPSTLSYSEKLIIICLILGMSNLKRFQSLGVLSSKVSRSAIGICKFNLKLMLVRNHSCLLRFLQWQNTHTRFIVGQVSKYNISEHDLRYCLLDLRFVNAAVCSYVKTKWNK